MKKTLLLVAAAAMSTMTFAQVEQKQSILKDVPEIETNINESEEFDAVEAADQATAPVIAIKRPGGLFFPGYQQKSTSMLTVPYAKAPAYVPLTWELFKEDWDSNIATGTFTLAVPYAKTVNDEAPEWITTDGTTIESNLIAMGSKFYPSPYATGANDKGETLFTLLPPYVKSDGTVTNPAQIYAGGAQSSSSSSGYQMSANYNVYWGTGFSYSSKYFGFNTTSSNEGWSSKYPGAKVKGICERFDKPASPYILKGANWYFYLPSGGSAGTLKMTIRKMEGNLIGDIVAVSYCEEPLANTATRMIYLFDNLEDADGNEISQVIIDSAIMIEVAPMEGDEDTNLIAYYINSPYYQGDSNAFVHLEYDKDGKSANTWAKAHFKWTKTDGTVGYQTSFSCGLVIIYPFAKVINQSGAPTMANVMDVPVEGGSKEFFFDAYYNYGAWKIYSEDKTVEVTYDSTNKVWKSNVDWLKISTVSGTTESGGFNGDVTMTVECAANSGAEQTIGLIVDCYGFKEPITINRAGSTDGIASIATENAANAKAVYNLAGQAVSAGYKGVTIKNGVKYINK